MMAFIVFFYWQTFDIADQTGKMREEGTVFSF
jgi:hypothetical protein